MNVIRGILVALALAVIVLLVLFVQIPGCLKDPPEQTTTTMGSVPVKPPLVEDGVVAVPDPLTGTTRPVAVSDAQQVEAVISVPTMLEDGTDTTTVILVDRAGNRWLPGFTHQPSVTLRGLGDSTRAVVAYQKPPLLALEMVPMLGAQYDGAFHGSAALGVARVWGFHFGPSVRLPDFQVDLQVTVEVVDHLHLGTGVLDALGRQPSITIHYAL